MDRVPILGTNMGRHRKEDKDRKNAKQISITQEADDVLQVIRWQLVEKDENGNSRPCSYTKAILELARRVEKYEKRQEQAIEQVQWNLSQMREALGLKDNPDFQNMTSRDTAALHLMTAEEMSKNGVKKQTFEERFEEITTPKQVSHEERHGNPKGWHRAPRLVEEALQVLGPNATADEIEYWARHTKTPPVSIVTIEMIQSVLDELKKQAQ